MDFVATKLLPLKHDISSVVVYFSKITSDVTWDLIFISDKVFDIVIQCNIVES